MDLRSGKQTGEESSESLSEQETTMEPGPMTGRGRKSAIQNMLEDMMKTIEEDRKRQEEDRRRLEETIKQGRKEDLQKLGEGRKEDLHKLEQERKEDLKIFEQGRKEDMEIMVKVIEKKVQSIKEEIRRETQTWKQDLKGDIEKTEQEIAMVAEMSTIGRNVSKNTHNIEQVKRQVEDRVSGNRNEMEVERRRTKEQIEELQK
ncbi:vicilin-like seed storage protein At2g18540 [Anoplophora glabripennis]|uniref:vicilin-like seed storage protein At2g18540 n=1 Tax=Anoplophora glabripennis TaxID=217634 RepID=UPI0008745EAF|nr:vicilin-like seed storage protein At2g18540 [Anoplophora glabripennis]